MNQTIPEELSDTEVGLLRIAWSATGGSPHRPLAQICRSGPPPSAVVELAEYWPGLSLEAKLIAVIQGMAFEPADWLTYTGVLIVDDGEGDPCGDKPVDDAQLKRFYGKACETFSLAHGFY